MTDTKNQYANPEQRGDMEARILAQALPFMQRYAGQRVVIKYGGNAMINQDLAIAFSRDIALLKQSGVFPVVIHGGGPQIGAMLERVGIQSQFKDGLRVTDAKTVEVVEMVLAGTINKSIVAQINRQGGKAIGLCGKDGNLVRARKLERKIIDPDSNIEKCIDLGFVGEPDKVDRQVLDMVTTGGLIPVIAPVCFDRDGNTYNVNADTFAGAIAGAQDAKRLLFLTDVPGVLDRDKNLIKHLTISQAQEMIEAGDISGGMIPKVETCIDALERGVDGVVIVDGTRPHAVLLELFTEHGAGTLLRRG